MAMKMLTLDEALRPVGMGCAKCGGRMVVYPCPIPEGTGYCPTCSPPWVKPFAEWLMNQERTKRGLSLLNEEGK